MLEFQTFQQVLFIFFAAGASPPPSVNVFVGRLNPRRRSWPRYCRVHTGYDQREGSSRCRRVDLPLGESGGSSFCLFPLQASWWRGDMSWSFAPDPSVRVAAASPLSSKRVFDSASWRTHTATHTPLKVSRGPDGVYVAAGIFYGFFRSLLIPEI